MNKEQVAQILTEIATLLELKGENPFKSRAYQNAARAIESLGQPLETVFAPDSEANIKGIGEGIHKKIVELLATGKLDYYDELKNSIPPGLLLMLAIPGLGPILVAGPLVGWIIAGLEGAALVGGVSAVGAGLVSIGIPKDSVLKYDVALKTDKFLLVVHGTPSEVDKAKDILAGTEHSHCAVHGETVCA